MLSNTAHNLGFKAVICRGKDNEGMVRRYWFPDNSDCIINKHSENNYNICNPNSDRPTENVKDLIIDLIDNGSLVHYAETVNSARPLIIDKISKKVDIETKIDLLYKNALPIEFNNKKASDNKVVCRNAGINLYAKARASIFESGEDCLISLFDRSKANLHKNDGDVYLNNNSSFEIAENNGIVISKNNANITINKNRGLLIAKDNTIAGILENFANIALKDKSVSNVINNALNGKIYVEGSSSASIKNNKSGQVIIPQNKIDADKRVVYVHANYPSSRIKIGDKNNDRKISNNDDISVKTNNGHITLYAPGSINIEKVQPESCIVAHGQGAIVNISDLDENISDKKAHIKNQIVFMDGASPGNNLRQIMASLVKPRIFPKTRAQKN